MGVNIVTNLLQIEPSVRSRSSHSLYARLGALGKLSTVSNSAAILFNSEFRGKQMIYERWYSRECVYACASVSKPYVVVHKFSIESRCKCKPSEYNSSSVVWRGWLARLGHPALATCSSSSAPAKPANQCGYKNDAP